MTGLLRVGRIVVVIAVIFFLAAGAALAGSSSSATRGQDAGRTKSSLRMPTEWVTAPASLLKETALFRARVQRVGETALVGFGVDLLTRSLRWVRHLGLVQVRSGERPSVGGV